MALTTQVESHHRNRTVLLVEDESILRTIMVEELVFAGFRVLEAETGEQAVDLIREHGAEIGFLFTDIRLPGVLSGWNVAFEFRFLHPLRPVVYATGYSPEQDQVSGSILLRKPYRPEQVVEALKKLAASVP